MEKYLRENFDVQPKRTSEEALRRWRSAASILKNSRRRFRMIADLEKRSEAEKKKLMIQEKIRVAVCVQKAALQFIDAGRRVEYKLSDEARQAGFDIDPDELASIVRGRDSKGFKLHGRVEGIARKISVSLCDGGSSSDLNIRQKIYGFNRFVEKPSRSFWMFVWDALQDLTLIILMICAVVSIGVGFATEGWPKGMYDGLGIIPSIFLVVMVTAVSDYKQSLQFRDLDKEKKKILIPVHRDGYRQKVSIHDLVVGDIVHLSIGDQVPADGVFVSGYRVSIDESSLSGESEPVNVSKENPFLLSGTIVQDGSAKMLVTSVGVRTEWGRLMETLSEGGEDETPLQVKLNGVATIIRKIGLAFSVLTFLVMTIRFLVEKILHNEFSERSSNDALKLLNFFAITVTILVVAVPEGLPLAVTLSLAFAMKKLMNDKALVRHLSACKMMGSASCICICTDKTGTLTTNHMVVDKIWLCKETKLVKGNNTGDILKSSLSKRVLSILLQSIFQNTGSEVVKGKDGKKSIIGSPTESALLEFGLILGGDFDAQRRESKIVKVEPFNSVKKKMSLIVALPDGGFRAFCKGAAEIILQLCDKVLDSNGESVPLSEAQIKNIMDVINGFADEALRTLCLAFKDMDGTFNSNDIPTDGYTLIAVVGIKDPVRPEVKDAVKSCLNAGITVRIATGDNINTTKAIAKECDLLTDDGLAIDGPDFRNKSAQEMELIPKLQVTRVMARSFPLDKHILVTQLQNMFEVVAVTGDGTNDAPALHEADIGLAMGIGGTEDILTMEKQGRGYTHASDVWKLPEGTRISITLNDPGQPVGENYKKLVKFLGTIIRNGDLAPLTYESWKIFPRRHKEGLWKLVEEKFDIEQRGKKWTLKTLGKKWKDRKAWLKNKYFDADNVLGCVENPPDGVLRTQWEQLVLYWSSKEGKV